jgi:hypothetical protein
MRIKIKSLIFTIIILFLGVKAFANIPVVTGDEPEAPKVLIKEGDKMTYDYYTRAFIGPTPRFSLLGNEYKYKNASFLFEAIGLNQWFNKLSKISNASDEYDIYIKDLVKKFNDFLAQTQEGRNRIAEIINEKLKQEWEEKKRKKEKEMAEEKRINELIGNRKLFFMNLNLGGGTLDNLYELFAGVGIIYFPSYITVSPKIGFSFNFKFSLLKPYSLKDEYNTYNCGYFFANANILFKFGKFYSYLFGIGGEVGLRLKNDVYNDFKKTYYGLRFENGFMYIQESTGWGLYFTCYVNLLIGEDSRRDKNKLSFITGGQISILLNFTAK